MMQQAAAFASGYKYNSSDTFNKLGINEKNSNESMGMLQAIGKGIMDTYGDSAQWEQFAIGALTGLVGVPHLSNKKLSMAGGLWDEIKEQKESLAEEKEKVNDLNKRLSDPKFVELYKGLTRHQTLDNAMQESLKNNDEFNFKNAEHQQMISDIITFHNTGRLQDYFDTIDQIANVQPSDVEAIKSQSINKQTGKSIFDDATKDEDVINHVKKQADKLKTTAEGYKKLYDTLSTVYGDKMDKETMSEMIYRMSNIDHLEGRFSDLFKEVKEGFKPFVETFRDATYKDDNGNDIPLLNILSTNPADFLIKATQEHNNLLQGVFDEHDKIVDKLDKKQEHFNNKEYKYEKAKFNALDKLNQLKEIVDNNEALFATIPNFSNKVTDLAKVMTLRNEFITDHIKYTKNPQLLSDKIQEEKEEVKQSVAAKDNKTLKTNLANSASMGQFREHYHNADDNKINREKILDELVKEEHPIAKQYKTTRDYKNEVNKAIDKMEALPEDKDKAKELFTEHAYNTDNLSDLANPDLTSTLLMDSEDDNINDNVIPLIYTAIKKANESVRFKDLISSSVATQESVPADAKNVVPPVKNIVPPIGGIINEEDVRNANEEVNTDINKEESIVTPKNDKTEPVRKYWMQAIHELNINKRNLGVYEDNEIENPRFANIIKILKNKGAFDYVNNGNLHIGDEIHFMVNDSLFEGMDNKDVLAGTIFLTTFDSNKEHQIIGVLTATNSEKFEGLKEFREKLLNEYSEFNKDEANKDKPFIYSQTTHAAKILPGHIITKNNFTNLKEVRGVDNMSVFGIMQNGKIIVPKGRIDDILIVNPKAEANREGRMYLLNEGADGRYYPVLVKTKRFNSTDFNLDDNLIKGTKRYERLKSLAIKLASIDSKQDRNAINSQIAAIRNIMDNDIYLADFHIDMTNGKIIIGKNGTKDTLIDLFQGGNTPTKMRLGSETDDARLPIRENDTIPIPVEEVAINILKAINEKGTYLQMDKNQLNSKNGYNEEILNDNLLSSNITDTSVRGAFFTMNYINTEGKEQTAENMEKKVIAPTTEAIKINPITNSVESVENLGTNVSFGGSTYYVQDNGDILSYIANTGKYAPVLDMDHTKMQTIKDLAWYKSNLKNPGFQNLHNSIFTFVDNKGVKTEVNGFITPDRKVFNMTTMLYLTKSLTEDFIKAHNNRLNSNLNQIIADTKSEVKEEVKTEPKEIPVTLPAKYPIFEYKGTFEDTTEYKDYPKIIAPLDKKKVGFYVNPYTNKVMKGEMAEILNLYGIPIYQVAALENGDVLFAVLPNGKAIGTAGTLKELVEDTKTRNKEELITLLNKETEINKNSPKEDKIEVINTPSSTKELTPEQAARKARRDALKGNGTVSQENTSNEYAEANKKIGKAEEKDTANENKTVKSLDNSNKKLTFAEIDSEIVDNLKKKFSESEWNSLTRDEQDKEIKCNS